MSNTVIVHSELDTDRLVEILEQADLKPKMHEQLGLFVEHLAAKIFVELQDLPALKLITLFVFEEGATMNQKLAFVNRANLELPMVRFFAHEKRNLLVVDYMLPTGGGITPTQLVTALHLFFELCMKSASVDRENILA